MGVAPLPKEGPGILVLKVSAVEVIMCSSGGSMVRAYMIWAGASLGSNTAVCKQGAESRSQGMCSVQLGPGISTAAANWRRGLKAQSPCSQAQQWCCQLSGHILANKAVALQ